MFNGANYINRCKSHYVFLLLPSRYEHDYILWFLEMDARRNISWLSRNIHTRNIQWDKLTHAPNQEEQKQITIYITPCTNPSKCTTKYDTKVWANLTLINSAYRFERLICWIKLRNWNRTNTTLYASRFHQVYRQTDMNGILEVNNNFTPQ